MITSTNRKAVWRFLKELKLELPFDPAIPLLGVCPKEKKSFCKKDTCTHAFYKKDTCSTIHINKDMESTWVPISGGLDKENVAHYTMEFHIAIKKRIDA